MASMSISSSLLFAGFTVSTLGTLAVVEYTTCGDKTLPLAAAPTATKPWSNSTPNHSPDHGHEPCFVRQGCAHAAGGSSTSYSGAEHNTVRRTTNQFLRKNSPSHSQLECNQQILPRPRLWGKWPAILLSAHLTNTLPTNTSTTWDTMLDTSCQPLHCLSCCYCAGDWHSRMAVLGYPGATALVISCRHLTTINNT